ncbi:MAG: N-formylglutamate amidohydrolase [Burkholderiales bacterium]|nr:N-formylglutamate amidohydrolase [Burkholderiales bacterium]
MPGTCLVVSCEHGGNDVPLAYAAWFAGHAALLDSHRGWDPGALQLAAQIAAAFGAPLYASTTTRLLIDLNRSPGHRHLYSEVTRGLPRAQRQAIDAQHYRPHRDAVEGEIGRRIASGQRVIHVASHSFTPVLDGVVRQADVAWLYDPRRAAEAALSRRWIAACAQRAPGLRLRRNYPYRGRGDGLTALLRKAFADEVYVGVELEVNQRFVAQRGAPWRALRADLVESLAVALAAEPAYHAG